MKTREIKLPPLRERENRTSLAPKMMVVSCERSPHSAKKVRVKACKKMGETRGPKHFSLLLSGTLVRPCSASPAPSYAERKEKGKSECFRCQPKDIFITDSSLFRSSSVTSSNSSWPSLGGHLVAFVEHLEAKQRQQCSADVESDGMRDDHGGKAETDGEHCHGSECRNGTSKHYPPVSAGIRERKEDQYLSNAAGLVHPCLNMLVCLKSKDRHKRALGIAHVRPPKCILTIYSEVHTHTHTVKKARLLSPSHM